MKKILTIALLISTMFSVLYAQNTSSLVYMDNGKLAYNTYAATSQSNSVHVIPDFSYAGYKGGGIALPDVPVVVTLNPTTGDRKQDIQDAIDQIAALSVDANGFRGAILLTAGTYEVGGPLSINTSGIVIKGEGQGSDGTILHATLTQEHDLINIAGIDDGEDLYTLDTSSKQDITDSYVPVGTKSFSVTDASSYQVGDVIFIRRTPNQFWVDDLGMDVTTLCEDKVDCVGWDPAEYAVEFERTITAISGNEITIELPIVDAIENQYGGGEIYKAATINRIELCGVENLRIKSTYASSTDENHMYFGINMVAVQNSWVSDVTAQHMSQGCVALDEFVKNVTVQNCAAIDHKSVVTGGKRYSFPINGKSLGNLIQRCYTKSGRHDFVNGSRVPGPNVFLDCYATDTKNDIGPHHRWTTGMLYDNVRGGQIRARNRGKSGTGHGWVGNTIVFWNNVSDTDGFVVQSPKGGKNFGIGCIGGLQWGNGFWELAEQPATPRSLFLQQLQDRLGTTAVENVAMSEQVSGTIYDLLGTWKGEGSLTELAESISNNNVAPTTITLSPSPLNVGVGASEKVTASFLPIDANTSVVWSSNDETVATVDTSGNVSGVKEGTVTITATSTLDNSVVGTATIHVITLEPAFVSFDDKNSYLTTDYYENGELVVNLNFHAGTGNTVASDNNNGIRYYLRHLNSGWVPQNDYLANDASAIGKESGTSTATISLSGAIPTAELPDGDFYWLWVNFRTSDGNQQIDAQIKDINILDESLSIYDHQLKKINFYPNPVKDVLNLEGDFKGEDLYIYTVAGKVVVQQVIENDLINLENLSSGMYFLRIGDGVAKFIKE